MLSSLNTCLITARVSIALFPRFAQNLMHTHRRIHCETSAGLQIKYRKKSARPPRCVKYCTLTPKISKYYHLLLLHAITNGVQMAALIPEIMVTPCIYVHLQHTCTAEMRNCFFGSTT
jgi:hypothetical protein